MKRFYHCAILILSVVLAIAQTLTETREFNVIPPAPDVASLLKFSETPVSPFTEQPDINIPIYKLREGSLSVPISIRYHGGGIKVSEASGVVGSGECVDNRLHTGKEFIDACGLSLYDNNARFYSPIDGQFISIDPLCEKYPDTSPYVHCNNNPLSIIDPTGMAWLPTSDQRTGVNNGYRWIPQAESYDSSGNLKPGLYEQAIFFSNEGKNGQKFNTSSSYNMGSSVATVYTADGTTCEYDACTYPSDTEKYATVPEGMYEAKPGMHKGSYKALRVGDVGTKNFYNNSIELGMPNPSNPGKTTANGINIHLPGRGNSTGKPNGAVISQGCLLIDMESWSDFMSHFNGTSSTISVTVSRSLSAPINHDMRKIEKIEPPTNLLNINF